MNNDYSSSNALSSPPPMSMPAPEPTPSKKKSSPKEKDDNRGEVRAIHIEPAENGFTVCVNFEPKKLDPKRDRWSQMPEDEDMVFQSSDEALTYVKSKMDAAQADEAAGE